MNNWNLSFSSLQWPEREQKHYQQTKQMTPRKHIKRIRLDVSESVQRFIQFLWKQVGLKSLKQLVLKRNQKTNSILLDHETSPDHICHYYDLMTRREKLTTNNGRCQRGLKLWTQTVIARKNIERKRQIINTLLCISLGKEKIFS